MQLGWYIRRLGRMSPAEVASRARDTALKAAWSRQWVRPGEPDRLPEPVTRQAFPHPLGAVADIDPAAKTALIAAAEGLLQGRWQAFAIARDDFRSPDWFLDPATQIRAPDALFAFKYPHRDPARVGNLKYVWEASRHQHLTVLAAAYFLTKDDRFAQRVASDLKDWWRRNPFLSGPHWLSGIELGLRLIAWVWCRRLLDGWPDAAALFEANPDFQIQLYRHQQYLHAFRSGHSSANNHVLAEAAGQLAAACAFPLFDRSETWRRTSAALLEREFALQTFPSGLNRELATEYHGFVLDLGLVAALECQAASHPLTDNFWLGLRNMMDALAAIVDAHNHPPRQGDADDGIGLLVDAPDFDHGSSLLHTGTRIFGPAGWWPTPGTKDARTGLMAALAHAPELAAPRPNPLAALAQDAGMAILRTGSGSDEIWCRCDSGPHGFLSTAAHAHADALSIELRAGGVEIFADAGTYCYHTDPPWRRYFRSTAAHNTIALAGKDQAAQSGPFMWSQHTVSRLLALDGLEGGNVAAWTAEHSGYAPLIHRRTVRLDRTARRLVIVDTISGGDAPGRLSFLLGPHVECRLRENTALLDWMAEGGARHATVELPAQLHWRVARGAEDPIEGWYSESFGRKQPTFQLIGEGMFHGGADVTTMIAFGETAA
ncbi:MAG: alginate lyase family protein [Rhizomicrobium sp.]